MEYTVESVINLYSKSINSSFDKDIIQLEGFYQKTGNKAYNGVFYDSIYDMDKSHKLTLLVKDHLREQIQDGKYYRFQGYLNRYDRNSKDGTFQLIFRISKILDSIDEHTFISKEEFDMVRKRFDRPSTDVEGLLLGLLREGKRPNLAIVLGSNSIIHADYKSGMDGSDCYNILEERISFSNHSNILRVFEKYDDDQIDLLVCMRGGGSGLEVFDHTKLAKKALDLKVPFVTALGHKTDITMLERVADRGFATPTSFGNFLKEIESKYLREQKKLDERKNEVATLQTQITNLQKEQQKILEYHQEDKKQLESVFQSQRRSDSKRIKRLTIALVIITAYLLFTLFLLFK